MLNSRSSASAKGTGHAAGVPFAPAGGTHTTAGAGVVIARGNQVLMVLQERASGMRWEIPSGGQEAGETLEQTAKREAFEETGAEVELAGLVCTYSSYRVQYRSLVLGAIYQATLVNPDASLIPQEEEGIVAAKFVDPWTLPSYEVGRLTVLVLEQWWPTRQQEKPPFHVELWRTREGYRRLDSATGELHPIDPGK